MSELTQHEVEVFNAARGLHGSARSAYLDQACAGEPAMRQRLEELLQIDESAADFLEQPVPADLGEATMHSETPLRSPPLFEKLGDMIGRYKLLENVGEGGCGVVYVAEQTEPVRRRVALKVIKLGMDTKQVVARFEAERQALAMMDHPNIAKVLDAGATETGRPYFVMELVRGIRITDYCDENQLTTEARLDLFIKVCQAIQHAHQKGIIHRDVKPSNILVTLLDGVPVPKIIDFGIAKATEGRLTNGTDYTQLHHFIGTPAYMSPEQAGMSGLDVDTRSDIYSLGVLLYELLAGRTPFDAKELVAAGLDAMRKTIREKEPVRPSTRLANLQGEELTTTSTRRSSDPPKLTRQLKGDLDWIVMKCLEKDRARRYETANGLAFDLKRHLNNEPVLARPPSVTYGVRKFVRRNQVMVTASAIVAGVLVLGVVASTWQAIRATRAERVQSRLREAAQASEQKSKQAEVNEAKQKSAAQQSLYKSLLGEARATRLARRPGYRDRVFALLNQAKALDVPGKNPDDLRGEAVACLGDFIGLSPVVFTNSLTHFDWLPYWRPRLAPTGNVVAFALNDGTVTLQDVLTGKEIGRLNSSDGVVRGCGFNSRGDQFFAARGDTNRQVFKWIRDATGQWRESADFPLPGATDIFASGEDVFCLVIEQTASTGAPSLRFRCFNVRQQSFLPGRELTVTPPVDYKFFTDETGDGSLVAIEIGDATNPTNCTVIVYNWTTGERLSQLPLPYYGQIALSRNGKYLAWTSAVGGALFSVPTMDRLAQFKEYSEEPAVFVGAYLAMPQIGQFRVRLWSLVTHEEIAEIEQPETVVPANATPDGNSLLVWGDSYGWIYKLKSAERMDLPPLAGSVTAVAFSPDGTRLASVSKDRVVRVSDVATGQTIWQATNLPGPGQNISYSPNGKWLATVDWNTALVWIWDAQTGQRQIELGTNGPGTGMCVQFSPDGRYLGTAIRHGRDNGVVSIWKIDENGSTTNGLRIDLIKSFPLARLFGSLSFSPNGRSVSFSEKYSKLYLWDFDRTNSAYAVGEDFDIGVQCSSYTPDGDKLLVVGDHEIVTLDAATGQKISSFRIQEAKAPPAIQMSSLSPDGARLAVTTSNARGVNLWNPKTGRLIYPLPEDNGAVYWLAWSPDGRCLAVARNNGSIAIWHLDIVGRTLAQLGLNP
jgi:serine/threonine protein kinase/WD40 repeat protein